MFIKNSVKLALIIVACVFAGVSDFCRANNPDDVSESAERTSLVGIKRFGVAEGALEEDLEPAQKRLREAAWESTDDTSDSDLVRDDDMASEFGDDEGKKIGDFESAGEEALTDELRQHYNLLKNKLMVINNIMEEAPGCRKIFGTYAIVGDIHGDFETCVSVLEILQSDIDANKIDGVVFLGDFWDRMNGDVKAF